MRELWVGYIKKGQDIRNWEKEIISYLYSHPILTHTFFSIPFLFPVKCRNGKDRKEGVKEGVRDKKLFPFRKMVSFFCIFFFISARLHLTGTGRAY